MKKRLTVSFHVLHEKQSEPVPGSQRYVLHPPVIAEMSQ